jgi:tRNA threonylcarbamoyladenosine biosynthesis protein TsaB
MNLLALDTSSDACSVALQIGGDLFEQHVVEPKQHTNILIPMIQRAMHDAGAEMDVLDTIVLGNGPGSFIGMRIGASVAQGLAYGSGLKIVPVSSMAAVAAEVIYEHPASEVIVAQDARMNEVYLARYRDDGNGMPVCATEEVLQPVARIEKLPESASSGLVAAGKGWQRYPEFFELNRHAISDVIGVLYPQARYLLSLGAEGFRRGDAIDPADLVPAYVRTKVAEKPAQT